MGRPRVPHCCDCPDAILVPCPDGGYHIYCPIIDPHPQPALILWWDRGHTSPKDCPGRIWRKPEYLVARPRKPGGPAIGA